MAPRNPVAKVINVTVATLLHPVNEAPRKPKAGKRNPRFYLILIKKVPTSFAFYKNKLQPIVLNNFRILVKFKIFFLLSASAIKLKTIEKIHMAAYGIDDKMPF